MGRKPKLESSEDMSPTLALWIWSRQNPGFLSEKNAETTGHVVKLNGYYHIKPLEEISKFES